MSDSPRYVGYLSPNYSVELADDDGIALNLTGATNFTLTLQNMSNPMLVKHGVGTWTIIDASNGKASYAYASADLNTAGNWLRFVSVQLAGESAPRQWDPDVVAILDNPVNG